MKKDVLLSIISIIGIASINVQAYGAERVFNIGVPVIGVAAVAPSLLKNSQLRSGIQDEDLGSQEDRKDQIDPQFVSDQILRQNGGRFPQGGASNQIPQSGINPIVFPQGSSGNQQLPQGFSGNQQFPQGGVSNQLFPQGPFVNQQFPQGSIGNQQFPQGSIGNQQFPQGPISNQQLPQGPIGNQQFPPGPVGNQQFPQSPIGNQQFPQSPIGNQQIPQGIANSQLFPQSPIGNQLLPQGGIGNQQFPQDAVNTGNQLFPQGAIGNQQFPQGITGNQQFPQGAINNQQFPQGAIGNQQFPQGTINNQQFPQNSIGNQQFPQSGVSNELFPQGIPVNNQGFPQNTISSQPFPQGGFPQGGGLQNIGSFPQGGLSQAGRPVKSRITNLLNQYGYEKVGNGKYAAVVNVYGTWDQAYASCKRQIPGATLFTVGDAVDSSWLGRKINAVKRLANSSKFWVGLIALRPSYQGLRWLGNRQYVSYPEAVSVSGYDDRSKTCAWAVPDSDYGIKYEFVTQEDSAEAYICQYR